MARQAAGRTVFRVCPRRKSSADGDRAYRFFELFDLPNIPEADALPDRAATGDIHLTPPPKTHLEEKMLFALFWNRTCAVFGSANWAVSSCVYWKKDSAVWLIDPAPLPPHAAIPRLEPTDRRQLPICPKKIASQS